MLSRLQFAFTTLVHFIFSASDPGAVDSGGVHAVEVAAHRRRGLQEHGQILGQALSH